MPLTRNPRGARFPTSPRKRDEVKAGTHGGNGLAFAGVTSWCRGAQDGKTARIHRTFHLLLVPLFASLPAVADPPAQPLAPVTPRNAEAEAGSYERCMKLAKHDPGAAERLALAWHERGGAHPADHCAAVALIGLKQYKEAATRLDALAQSMTTAPPGLRAEVLDQAGQAWGLAGDPARAYAAAGAAVALQPNDLDLLVDRSAAAAGMGYFDKAIADLDHVLKADPRRIDALIYRASANRALGRLDPALVDVEKALELAPGSVPALLERGNLRRLKGDGAGARQDWERIGQLAPGSQADMAAKANIERLESKEVVEPAKSQHAP